MNRKTLSSIIKAFALISLIGAMFGMFQQKDILTGEIIWPLALAYMFDGLFRSALIYGIAILLDGQETLESKLNSLKTKATLESKNESFFESNPDSVEDKATSLAQQEIERIKKSKKQAASKLSEGE